MAVVEGTGVDRRKKKQTERFPTLPTVQANGNANPAGNRLGGVGTIEEPHTPEGDLQAMGAMGNFRSSSPGAGTQTTPQATTGPTVTAGAAPTPVALTATGGTKPADPIGEGIRKLLDSGKITAIDVEAASKGDKAALARVRAALFRLAGGPGAGREALLGAPPADFPGSGQDLVDWLKAQSTPTTPGKVAPLQAFLASDVKTLLGQTLISEEEAMIEAEATGRTLTQVYQSHVDDLGPEELNKHGFRLGHDEYVKQVVTRLQQGIVVPAPTNSALKVWYDEAATMAGKSAAAEGGADYITTTLASWRTTVFEAAKASGWSGATSFRKPPEPLGYNDDGSGHLTFAPPPGSGLKEDPQVVAAYEEAIADYNDFLPLVTFNRQHNATYNSKGAEADRAQAQSDRDLADKKYDAFVQHQAERDAALDAQNKLTNLFTIMNTIYPDLMEDEDTYDRAEGSGFLAMLTTQLAELKFTGVDFKRPTRKTSDEVRQKLLSFGMDTLRKWTYTDWTKFAKSVRWKADDLVALWEELAGGGAMGQGGATVTTVAGQGN